MKQARTSLSQNTANKIRRLLTQMREVMWYPLK